jgi:hypothetical protein
MFEVVNGGSFATTTARSPSVAAHADPVAPLSVMFNWVGAELPATITRRSVFDVVAILKATSRLTLGVNGDYGSRTHQSRDSGSMRLERDAGYAVLGVTDKFSVALRGETFHDDGGARLGTDTPAVLNEGTLTSTYKFTNHVLVRGEVRFDSANGPILAKQGGFADRQTTVGANVVFVY